MGNVTINGKNVVVDTWKSIGGRQYKWFDWVKTKREANAKAKNARGFGLKARVIPYDGGYHIYTAK